MRYIPPPWTGALWLSWSPTEERKVQQWQCNATMSASGMMPLRCLYLRGWHFTARYSTLECRYVPSQPVFQDFCCPAVCRIVKKCPRIMVLSLLETARCRRWKSSCGKYVVSSQWRVNAQSCSCAVARSCASLKSSPEGGWRRVEVSGIWPHNP